MRIGFITLNDPRQKASWSGTTFSIFNKLSERHEVEWLNPGGADAMAIDLSYKLVGRLTGRPVRSYRSRMFVNVLRRRLQRYDLSKYDLLFSIGSSEIAGLETDVPIIHLADATFAQMIGYYDGFDVGETRNDRADRLQRSAYEVSTQIILASNWAASSARGDYRVLEDKINVLKFGANHAVPSELPERTGSGPHLLFIGKDWERKGGAIAVDALNSLRRRGIDATLTMIGCTPPGRYLNTPHATFASFVDDPSAFLRDSDIFILPTRAECAGIVFCEASGYGLPCFSTATGGVPDYVDDGISGRLLPIDAIGDDFAASIAELWNDPDAFREMRLAARRKYEKELNWDAWMQGFDTIANRVISSFTASRG